MNRRMLVASGFAASIGGFRGRAASAAAIEDLTAQEVLYIGRTDAAMRVLGATTEDLQRFGQESASSVRDLVEEMGRVSVVWRYAADLVFALEVPSTKLRRLDDAIVAVFEEAVANADDVVLALASRGDSGFDEVLQGLQRVSPLIQVATKELNAVLA